jgi:uncharacterized cysteine cluster protein YcgN (CxxCxxCC family)
MTELRDEFWLLPLEALDAAEWEALCDGCGLCCLVKLEDEDTERIYFTSLVCALLDPRSCRCSDYPNRHERIPDCRAITLQSLAEISWLPPSCAYVLRSEGKPLKSWHPLISGDRHSVHTAGRSARGWTTNEQHVHPDDVEDYLVANPFKAHRKKST